MPTSGVQGIMVTFADMDNVSINERLRQEALSLGICDKALGLWDKDLNDGALIELGYRNIDFLLKHHWPANETLKSIWSKDFLRSNGVFVDDRWSVNNAERGLVLGGSKATMRYNGWTVGRVYARDDSQVIVSAKNKSTVFVHAFEKAWIGIEQHDSASVVVIRHSDSVVVSQNCGFSKIIDEFTYLD